jgi:hypothetical protein
MMNNGRLARFLGWFSIALGLAQVLAPRRVATMVGTRGDGNGADTTRLIGVREIMAGAGILATGQRAPWLWARVAGDAMDLALLGANLKAGPPRRTKAALSILAVAGIAALDWITAKRSR